MNNKKIVLFVLAPVAVASIALMFRSPELQAQDSASREGDRKTNSPEIKYSLAPMDKTNARTSPQIKSVSVAITNGNSISNRVGLPVELFPVVVNLKGSVLE